MWGVGSNLGWTSQAKRNKKNYFLRRNNQLCMYVWYVCCLDFCELRPRAALCFDGYFKVYIWKTNEFKFSHRFIQNSARHSENLIGVVIAVYCITFRNHCFRNVCPELCCEVYYCSIVVSILPIVINFFRISWVLNI